MPNQKEATQDLRMTEYKKKFLVELRQKIANDDSSRSEWKSKMIIANNQRLGIKRVTDTPYEGAPDIPLPEADKLIKKALPNLVLSAWSPKTLATVKVRSGVKETPELREKARRSEMALNDLLRNKIDWFNKLYLAADNVKEKGHCIFRVYEEFKTIQRHKRISLNEYPKEVIRQLKSLPKADKKQFVAERFGFDIEDEDDLKIINQIIEDFDNKEEVIEFDYEDVISMPNVEIPLPTKIIVPPYTKDINKAKRITYEFFLTEEELDGLMRQDTYKEKDLEKLDYKTGESDSVEKQKEVNEGVSDNASEKDLYKIHQILTYFRTKEKGKFEKWVFTFLADVADPEEALLQEIRFPYDFEDGGWNLIKHDNEIKDPRYFSSRGIPEQIRGPHEMMERAINNMLIRDEINNNPMYEVLSTSELMEGHIHFVPGEKLPVSVIGGEIRRLNDPITIDLSSERIAHLLKAYIEEYTGSVDQLFRNATNAGGGKTLGEIQEGVRQNSGPLSLDVISWNESLTKVYSKLFDILKDSLKPIFLGGIWITKEDFNFPAEIRSNGNLELSDKELATQKAQNRMLITERFLQIGVSNLEDYYNAAKDWLEKDGVKDPDIFITNPEEMLTNKISQMQQMVQQLSLQAQGLRQEVEKGTKEIAQIKKTNMKARANKIAEYQEAINGIRPKRNAATVQG